MRTLIFTLALLLGACSSAPVLKDDSGQSLIGASHVYTLTNLHADPQRKRLFAVNYQQSELIPLCTEVKLLDLSAKRLQFTSTHNNVTYHYFYHKKAAAEPFDAHLKRYFGTSCNTAEVKALSKTDQEGISTGKVKEGMSKKGVILAAGYPPPHVTPSTDANEWTYWKNRYDRFIVRFNDAGIVDSIQD
ncbi:MAG: hypothetical protein MJA28_14520 [Gammaproteobacteria bacterium]|nr:hypothetical protein [Gammaproteobacteria bacterium]